MSRFQNIHGPTSGFSSSNTSSILPVILTISFVLICLLIVKFGIDYVMYLLKNTSNNKVEYIENDDDDDEEEIIPKKKQVRKRSKRRKHYDSDDE